MKHGKVWFAALALVVAASNAAPATASEIGFGGYNAPGAPVSEEFVLGPTNPGKWGSPVFGTGAVVTWSLTPTGTACGAEPGCGTLTHLQDFMPANFLTAIQAAFAAWAAVADLTFIQVPDNGLPFNAGGAAGDIRISGHFFDGAGGTLAHGYYPPNNGVSAAGDIHFDIGDTWEVGFGNPDGGIDGFDIFQVMAHELGHALGLDHTGVPSSLMNAFYTEAFSGPQGDDIAGMVFIYGPANQGPGPDPIPEPATLMLLGSGLFAAAARRRAVKK